MRNRIVVSSVDLEMLSAIVEGHHAGSSLDVARLAELERELDRADVVEPAKVPAGVITMHSTAHLLDLDSGVEMTYRLVYPSQARGLAQEVSVLAPVGTALLGYRAGDVIEWTVPKGKRRLRVLKVTPRA